MDFSGDIYDKVFLKYGMYIYTNEYIKYLREQNLKLEADDVVRNWIPQEGFQEDVAECDADILIIGGRRGGGKTAIMQLSAMRYIDNPLLTIRGFRKEEGDIERGLWESSKKIYGTVAEQIKSDFRWIFPSGASSIYTRLQNEQEIDRRFRGVEMPVIIIDELTQISAKTFFFLLSSNRNTIGIKNTFIGSCNPVGPKHWVHKLLQWYINPETKRIIPERNGKKRYFFKYGKDISEIIWGNTKEEVYAKAKDYIDAVFDSSLEKQGLSPLSLINSLCFIEGKYSENKLFIRRDPNYLGNLAAVGGDTAERDIGGIWDDSDDTEALILPSEWEMMYNNTPQTNGIRTAVADVAFSRDYMILGAFDGNHLFDIEAFNAVGSETAVKRIDAFLERNNIPYRYFAFDADGPGVALKEHFKVGRGGAIAYNNNSAASDSQVWYNLRAECTDMFVVRVKECKFSIDPSLLKRSYGGKTIIEHLDEERECIRRKFTDNGKFQVISKAEIKKILGKKRSSDITDMIRMHEVFNKVIKKGSFKGLSNLRFL